MGVKCCIKCKKYKSLISFYKYNRSDKEVIYSYCKTCSSIVSKLSHAKRVGKSITDIVPRFPKVVNDNKYCSSCKQYKKVEEFFKSNIIHSGLTSHCKYCCKLVQTINRRIKKMEFVLEYGGKCVCCGEKGIEFLTIEHIKNSGNELHYANGTTSMINYLKANKWPKDKYTVLCFNCNLSIKDGVPCMHNKKEYDLYISKLEKFMRSNKAKFLSLREKLNLVGD